MWSDIGFSQSGKAYVLSGCDRRIGEGGGSSPFSGMRCSSTPSCCEAHVELSGSSITIRIERLSLSLSRHNRRNQVQALSYMGIASLCYNFIIHLYLRLVGAHAASKAATNLDVVLVVDASKR